MSRPAVAFALCLAVCGCDPPPREPVRSEDLSADEISFRVELFSNGGLVQVFATPSPLESGLLDITGEDRILFAPAGEPEQELALHQWSYLGQMETSALDFEVILDRGGGERFPIQLTLPPHFALSASDTPVSRSEPIQVMWDAGDGSYGTTLEVDAPCLTQRFVRALDEDTGAFSIQPADLFFAAAEECDLQVTLTRTASGGVEVAPGLGPLNGADLRQIRVVSIPTLP